MGEIQTVRRVIVFVVVFALVLTGGQAQVELEDTLLAAHLLDHGYSTVVRPVVNQADMITVEMDIALIRILDMDETNQIMTANTFMTQSWKDAFLQWDPADFWNITELQVPIKSIWRPDILLYNNANDNLEGGIRWTYASVMHDGTVTWMTNAIFLSACPMNPLYFPFDTQNCSLQLGSWTHNGDHIDVVLNNRTTGDDSMYQANGEWDLISFPARREVVLKDCCAGTFPTVTFNLVLKRRAMFYFNNLVIPCVIISSLVLLTFILPSEACERITLTLTILLSLTVFLLLVAETMPPTSEVVPLISQYYAAIIVVVGLMTVASVVTVNLHHAGDSQRAPLAVRRFILGTMATYLGVKTIPADNGDAKTTSSYTTDGKQRHDDNGGVLNPVFEDDDGNGDPFEGQASTSSASSTSNGDVIDMYVTKISRGMSYLTKLAADECESKQISKEWMHIAMVIDRFFVYFFALLCFIITLSTIVAAAVKGS